jgi:hypothetical protein
MTNLRQVVLGFLFLIHGAVLSAREETFPFYEDHRVTIDVPDGYTYARSFSESGVITARITDPKREISLEISFLPDPDGQFATPRARRLFMAGNFQTYVAGSVEKEMRFEELKPRTGSATICVFTDTNLVGKTELPPNEYLNATTGLKRWPGCAAYFTLLSNGLGSPAYQTALKIITESVHDKKPQATF